MVTIAVKFEYVIVRMLSAKKFGAIQTNAVSVLNYLHKKGHKIIVYTNLPQHKITIQYFCQMRHIPYDELVAHPVPADIVIDNNSLWFDGKIKWLQILHRINDNLAGKYPLQQSQDVFCEDCDCWDVAHEICTYHGKGCKYPMKADDMDEQIKPEDLEL